MKINEPIWINPFIQRGKNQADANLKRSQKTGDDYFWCHQQQLENSALQFKPLDLEITTTPLSFDESMNFVDKAREADREMKDQQILEYQTTKPLELEPESGLSNFEPQFFQDCASPSRNFNTTVPDSYCPLLKPKIPDSIDLSVIKILPRTFVFKEHQLFISKNEAELSLNGSNLNRQELKELVQLIKKWFFNHGIKLNKLIINGEKQ